MIQCPHCQRTENQVKNGKTIVSHPSGGEDGAVLEVFNAVGESIMVTTVPISAVAPLKSNQVPAVRPFVQMV